MRKSALLYLLLALVGLQVGTLLDGPWTHTPPPALELDFGQGCERAALSPDGRFVAGLLRRADGWYLGVADMLRDSEIAPFPVPDPPARVQTFAWHAGSRWVAYGCADRVYLLDMKEGKTTVLAANPSVRQVLFRGDTLLARADGNVYLWNVKSGKQTFRLEVSHLLQSDLSTDGKTLAIGCFGEGVRLVAVPSKRVKKTLADGLVPSGIAFCNNDRWVALGLRTGNPQEDHARLYDVPTGRQLGPNMTQLKMRGMSVSHDGARLLTCGELGSTVWQPSTGQKVCVHDSPSGLISVLSPDGRLAASNETASTVTVWDADKGGETLHTLDHPATPLQINWATHNRLEVAGDRYRLWWIR